MAAPHPGFQQEQLHPDVLEAVEAAFAATSDYIAHPDPEGAAITAHLIAYNALLLPDDQVYRYELSKDLIYDSPDTDPRPLPAEFAGKLAFISGDDVIPRLELPGAEGRNHLHAYPLVPHPQKAELHRQEIRTTNVGLAIALGVTAFREGRLTIVRRGYAESLVPSGHVFNPEAAQAHNAD